MPNRPLALVADANRDVNRYIVATLIREGFDFHHLAGPWELTAPTDGTAALVVLGGQRHGVAAAAAALALRHSGDTTPILILANGNDPAAETLAEADPGVRVVHKPFLPTELVDIARQLVGMGKPPA